jgi:pSer/pThr/pTyr-binding forkhead associated (FHA) protein
MPPPFAATAAMQPAVAAAAQPPTAPPAAPVAQSRAFLQTHAMQDAPVRPQLQPAISPGRVVGVGGAEPAKTSSRICPRCRGACDSAAQFCRYCGASLGAEPPQVAIAPIISQVIGPPVPSSGPTTDPAPPPAMSAVDPVQSLSPATPPIDENQYRAYQAMAAGSSNQNLVTPTFPAGRLVLIARDGGEGAQFPLGETTDIGRLEGQILLADDRYVAPRHARLAWRNGTLYLRDLGTPNGLYLRLALHHDAVATTASSRTGASSTSEIAVALRDQDLFLVGQQVLRFEVVNDAVEGFGAASQHGTLLFGTPAAPRYARLCQRTVEGVTRDVFYLRKVETVLGRELGDIVFTDDPFLSRRHAALRVDATTRSFTLVDLGSSNGTFLQIRDEVMLRSGDQFRIGQQLFRVDVDAAARS